MLQNNLRSDFANGAHVVILHRVRILRHVSDVHFCNLSSPILHASVSNINVWSDAGNGLSICNQREFMCNSSTVLCDRISFVGAHDAYSQGNM